MDEKLREPLREQMVNCSLPAALEAMGERWSFMILRAAFNGLHHFEEFQSELGIARNILANRLGRLVEHGILTRTAVAADRRKIQYELTEKGAATGGNSRKQADVLLRYNFPAAGLTDEALGTLILMVLSTGADVRRALVG